MPGTWLASQLDKVDLPPSYAQDAWQHCEKRNTESRAKRHKQRNAGKRKSNKKRTMEMRDFVDGTAFNYEQGQRSRKLFAAVVLAALDDAIADDKKYGNGPEQIAPFR